MEASVDLYLAAEALASADTVAPAAVPRNAHERRASRAADHPDRGPDVDRKLGESICEALIDSGSLALAAIDDGCITFASPAFLRLLGLSSAQGETATSWCRRVHTADRKRVSALLADAVTTGHAISATCLVTEPGGGATRVHIAGYPAGPRSPGTFTLLLHVDVKSRPAQAAPGLPAPVRRAFARVKNEVLDRAGELLVDAWLKSESLAILAVALRPPESGWSAQERQQTEEALMAQLRPCLRDGDAMGRNGDEGLLIAIPNLSGASSAAIVAGRLIEAARRAAPARNAPGAPDLNIGIALFPDDEQELSGLLAHAGAALDIARQSGANHYSLAETSLNLAIMPRNRPHVQAPKVGLAQVDAHHGQVCDELHAITHDIATARDLVRLRAGLDRIKQALAEDFRIEDAIMDEHPGAQSEAHRKEHRRVLRNIDFLARADARQSIALATQFLHDWLPEHIRDYDAPLVVSTFRPLW
jgi:hemerythrin-like metal-binding protein